MEFGVRIKMTNSPNEYINHVHSINFRPRHYNDVIMSSLASQITSLTIVYSIVYSSADQRKHQSSASLAFVRGIHRGPVNSPHKGPVTRKMFPFDDVIMVDTETGISYERSVHGRVSDYKICSSINRTQLFMNMLSISQAAHRGHYGDVIMSKLASQVTSLTIVYSTVYSGTDQRKHQSSASLAFVREIHREPVNSPHKRPVTRKMFPFDYVTMEMASFLNKIDYTNVRIRRWISNYIHVKQWDVITHPCPNFNGGLIKPLLKLGHGWVITSQMKTLGIII